MIKLHTTLIEFHISARQAHPEWTETGKQDMVAQCWCDVGLASQTWTNFKTALVCCVRESDQEWAKPGKQDTVAQCWFEVGPSLQTVEQRQISIGERLVFTCRKGRRIGGSRKHGRFTQSCPNGGPPSATLGRIETRFLHHCAVCGWRIHVDVR